MFLHPLRRLTDFNIFQYPHSKTTAQICRLHIYFRHFGSIAAGSFLYSHIWHSEFRTQNSSSFTCQTNDICTITAVGCQVNIQHHVIQSQNLFYIHANRCIRRQDENTIALFRQQKLSINAQLFSAAQHSKRIKSAHFCFFKLHPTGKLRPNNCNRYDIVLMDILRTSQNLYDLTAAVIHHTNPQMIRIRMTLNLCYFTGNNAFQPRSQIVHTFNFQTYACQFFSQLFRSDININIFF